VIEDTADESAVLHQPGDVRFGKLRPYLAKGLLMQDEGIGSGELLVLRPGAGIDSRFLAYLVISKPFVEWATATSYGVKMPRTSWSALGAFKINMRSIEDQQRIARYLDCEIARVDALVGECECSLRLNGERWLSRLESRFLSGHPRRLKTVLREWPTYGVLVPEFVDEGVPFVRVADLQFLEDDVVPGRRIPRHLSDQYRRTVLQGDEVLVSVVGSLNHAAVVPQRLVGANVARAVGVLRPSERLCPPSVLAAFVATRQYQDQARLVTDSDTAQPTLNMSDLANFVIRLPDSTHEIADMNAALRGDAAEHEVLSTDLRRQIVLLQEHRRALITHAVTQGIDGLPGVA
jgi:type I restriction enzyme S subunit